MADKILVVDDDACSRTGLAAFFQAHGFEVENAGSAREAITLGRSFVPDILISDWMLGEDCDGVDVARALHAHCPRLAIIFITGQSTDRLRLKTLGLPVYRVLPKPLSLLDLKTVVDLIPGGRTYPPQTSD
jgi:DNA-binding response OmpR family regulator